MGKGKRKLPRYCPEKGKRKREGGRMWKKRVLEKRSRERAGGEGSGRPWGFNHFARLGGTRCSACQSVRGLAGKGRKGC